MKLKNVMKVKLLDRIRRRLSPGEAGQTTAEYALVILGVAVVAGGLAIWAKGGAIKDLFDDIIGKIL
jgi:Flp pilus assembly pilin Flp